MRARGDWVVWQRSRSSRKEKKEMMTKMKKKGAVEGGDGGWQAVQHWPGAVAAEALV